MLARLLPKSLALRAIALSTLWAALSLAAISTVILKLHRDAIEENFEYLLESHLLILFGAVGPDDNGVLTGFPDLGDIRYSIKNSGWYWSVVPDPESSSTGLTGVRRSPSMAGQDIALADSKLIPFSADSRRHHQVEGLESETVDVLELRSKVGPKDLLARFRVMGNRSQLEADIGGFANRLYLALTLFGLGSIAVNALAILLGLNPLRKAQDSLRLIREGKAQRLDGEFPTEIAPLATEMNALIDNNRRIMERARTQVGNLAHSLKTPLAVMMNEGSAMGGARGKTVSEQANAMQEQIQHYLQRARIAAQRDSIVFRAPVTPILERLMRVMQKLNPEKTFEFSKAQSEIVFAGEGTDLEEILGNLLENAAKWGRRQVLIRLDTAPRAAGAAMFSIEIGDDGPGLTKDQIKDGIKRGKRLDETKPGTGLGLSIVQDTVKEYGGTLVLGKSLLGGLSATISLPMAE